jgi:hypothetical protein
MFVHNEQFIIQYARYEHKVMEYSSSICNIKSISNTFDYIMYQWLFLRIYTINMILTSIQLTV